MNLVLKDAAGTDVYLSGDGDGTDVEPILPGRGEPGTLKEVTLSLDTAIYATGDVLANTQEVTEAVRIDGGRAILESLVVIDQDDQKQGLDLWFLDTANDLGTENSAPDITDAEALTVLGYYPVVAADYKDLGGVAVANFRNIGMHLKATALTRSIFVGAILTSGTPTYTASGINLRLGIRWL